MENLIFSLNATMPIFLMLMLGLILKSLKIIDKAFAEKLNSFVFKITLPCMLFSQLSGLDFKTAWDTKFALFCLIATAASIFIAFLFSLLLKNKSERGEFIQASYRSSASILGIALIQNIYGNMGFGPLMIIASVPLYNIMAVFVLSTFSPENSTFSSKKAIIKKTLFGIITNPIIIGIAIGLIWSALKLPLPGIIDKTVTSVGSVTTPLGLMAMGAEIDLKKARGKLLSSISAAALKLFGFAGILLPFAISLGFRNESLVAILVMLGSATTVSCYVMAKNMGHSGILTSNTIMLTTLASGFSLTFWLFILKNLSLI